MAGEIFTTAGLCIVLTLVGVALGYGILRVTQGGQSKAVEDFSRARYRALLQLHVNSMSIGHLDMRWVAER